MKIYAKQRLVASNPRAELKELTKQYVPNLKKPTGTVKGELLRALNFVVQASDEDGETFYWAPKTVGAAILYLYNESFNTKVRDWVDAIDNRQVYYPDTNEIEDLIERTLYFMGEEHKDSPLGQFYDSKTSDNGLTKYRKEALKQWSE
jgi:hypothetical protein